MMMQASKPLSSLPASPASHHTRRWRLELFFKSQAELQSLIPFLKAEGISRVNIPNKNPEDGLLEAVRALQREGISDVCVHYSIKNQVKGRTTAQAGTSRLVDFMTNLTSSPSSPPPLSPQTPHHPSPQKPEHLSVLLVTGSGKKRSFNTVSALQQLGHAATTGAASGLLQLTPALYVAFNPYLSGDALVEEYARLKEKLSSPRLAGVYLQVGTDLEKLQQGLDFLRCTRDAAACRPRFEVLGSVLVPSKQLLARMRFRPWNGVFLSEEYLSGVAAAEAITRQLLEVYACNGVVPLVESSVRTRAELAHVLQLLGAQQEQALPALQL